MISLHPLTRRGRKKIRRFWGVVQTWPWLDTLKTLRLRFSEDRLGVTASSLTFTTLISLVPLLTVMLAAFTAFPMFAKFQDALQRYFLQSLVPDTIARPVLGALTQFASKANRLGSLGLVVLVFSALALMLTIDRTLNNIWRVRQPRPIGQRVLVYWAAVTLGPVLLGMSLTLTSYAVTVSMSQGVIDALPGGLSLLLNGVELLLFAAALAGLFHHVPNTHVRWRHALAGGLFSATGFEVAKKVLSWYLGSVPTYRTIYGAFATVPILLIWIYLTWVIVLLGAVVAAYGPSLQMKIVRRPAVPGYRFHLAVSILRQLASARESHMHGLSASRLSERLRTDPLQIEPLLDALVDIDWVGRLDEAGRARYVLLCDPDVTPATKLIEKVLLDPALELDSFRAKADFKALSLHDVIAASASPAVA